MTPKAIVREAKNKGIDIIGISDHNSAENVVVAKKVGQRENLTVIGGMEVTSSEEVHLLAFFDEDEDLLKFQELVYENLMPGVNNPEFLGEQVVVNEIDQVLGFNQRLLITSTKLSISKLIESIHIFEGMAIAAHIDREGFGIIGQLGFIPPDLKLDGLEVSSRVSYEERRKRFPKRHGLSFITSSDAHYLPDIGKGLTQFLIKEPTVKEMKMALSGKGKRKIR